MIQDQQEDQQDQHDQQDQQDCLKIKGIVEIINGDTRIIANNKFTQSMLSWLANIISVNAVGGATNVYYKTWGISTYAWNIYLGTDTTTPTAYNTPALTNSIGTAATTQTGYTQNPSNGPVFNVIFTATWNPGIVSGTIGEMALYLSVRNALQGFGWTIGTSTDIIEAKQLVSRLAAADGAFTPFIIIAANPLTINWTVQYSFT